MKTSSIYTFRDPRTQCIRYVGICVSPIKYRVARHWKDARAGSILAVHRWLRKLDGLGLSPIVECIEQTTDRSREVHWIAFYRAAGAPLLNLTDGGEGMLGHVPTPATRAKKAAIWTEEMKAEKRAEMTGTKHSAEVRAKIGLGNKGKKMPPPTPERLVKMRAASLGRKLSPEAREKISASKLGKKRPPLTEAQCQERSKRAKGRRHTEEAKQKCRAAKLGKKRPPLTEEWKQRIGESLRRRGRPAGWREACARAAKARVKMTDADVMLMRQLHSSGKAKPSELMHRFQCSKTNVYGILRGERRADIL